MLSQHPQLESLPAWFTGIGRNSSSYLSQSLFIRQWTKAHTCWELPVKVLGSVYIWQPAGGYMILLHIEMKGSEVDTLTKSVTEMNVWLWVCICWPWHSVFILAVFVWGSLYSLIILSLLYFISLVFYEIIRCCISKRPATSLVAILLISDKDHISFVNY